MSCSSHRLSQTVRLSGLQEETFATMPAGFAGCPHSQRQALRASERVSRLLTRSVAGRNSDWCASRLTAVQKLARSVFKLYNVMYNTGGIYGHCHVLRI